MQLLKGKKAIVTGGTSGIGREIALLFAKNGASVAIFGTNPDRASQALAELESAKVFDDQQFSSHLIDVSQFKSVEEELKKLLADWKNIDILVNNAGITKDNLLLRMSEEDWDSVMGINLKSVFNTCKILTRPMMKAQSGKIINITSVIGLTGNAGQVNYAASKSGMIGFTKSLAKELASRGICVNCVAPGYIQTPMTEKLTDQIKEGILQNIPLKRIGISSDIAQAVLFLASGMSDYITGQVITVDGGMVM